MSNAHTAEATTLKLTVSPDGEVWYLDGDSLPRKSNKTCAEFVEQPVCMNAERVRVVGSVSNAELILRLHEMKLRDQVDSVQVCSPLVCPSRDTRENPEQVLFHMRRWYWPASMGGWHETTRADFCSYAMALHHARGNSTVELVNFFRQHPVYRPLTFLPVHQVEAAKILAEVIDPRWYIDVEAPDRPAKLFTFLGLSPQVQAKCVGGATNRVCDLNRTVQTVWDVELPLAAADEPDGFLRRYHLSVVASGKTKQVADLRTSQRFIEFLRQIWLDAVYDMPPGAERLFAPDLYFGSPDERVAFARHMQLDVGDTQD